VPARTAPRTRRVDDDDYRRLLDFRTGLRRFLHWSEQRARAVGLSAAQHQLMLAIRGHSDPRGPTIGDVADQLLLRHHSAVGLVDRAEAAGLVRRRQDRDDHRIVRLHLTARGAEKLQRLTAATLEELARLSPRLRPLWAGLDAG
jgi:DNA-binding MarR family transcriptional regulator